MRSRMLGGLAAALMAVTVSLAGVHRARAAEAPKEVIQVSPVSASSDSEMVYALAPVLVTHVESFASLRTDVRSALARSRRIPASRDVTAADVILCLVAERTVDSIPFSDPLLSRIKFFVPPRYESSVQPMAHRIGARGSAVNRSARPWRDNYRGPIYTT